MGPTACWIVRWFCRCGGLGMTPPTSPTVSDQRDGVYAFRGHNYSMAVRPRNISGHNISQSFINHTAHSALQNQKITIIAQCVWTGKAFSYFHSGEAWIKEVFYHGISTDDWWPSHPEGHWDLVQHADRGDADECGWPHLESSASLPTIRPIIITTTTTTTTTATIIIMTTTNNNSVYILSIARWFLRCTLLELVEFVLLRPTPRRRDDVWLRDTLDNSAACSVAVFVFLHRESFICFARLLRESLE